MAIFPTPQGVVSFDQQDGLNLSIAREYRPLFKRLTAIREVFLARAGLPSNQRGLLEKLRYVFSRLPVLTREVDFYVILEKASEEPGSGLWSYSLEISHTHFRASQMCYIGHAQGGVRAFTIPVFHCENHGKRHDRTPDGQDSLSVFGLWLRDWEFLCRHPQPDLMIFNQREFFDWHQAEDPLAWEKMPSLFQGGGLSPDSALA